MQFNIADLYESVADAIPDRLALVSGDRRLTYAALDERANRLAHALLALGVGPGDHVGLYLYNGAEFVEAMLASFKIRAVPINVNYRYVEEELAYLFRNADLEVVLHQRAFTQRIAAVAPGVPALRHLIAVDDDEGAVAAGTGSLTYEALLADASPRRDFAPRSQDDRYVIYTGGTTGLPRGVVWRQEDVFFSGLQGGNPGGPPLERADELAPLARSGDKALTMLPAAPLIHGAAQWAVLIGLFGGGKVVLQPGRSFDAARIWRLVTDEQVTTITLVGDAMARPLVDALAAAPPGTYDPSSLVVIASAGAILSSSVKERLRELLPGTLVLNNFGASESGHQGSAFPAGTPEEEAARRSTFFMDDTSAVLGDDLRPIAPGSGIVGRLARRGRVPVAYYNDPEKTAKTFVEVEGVRWSIPGDLATVEADGMITVFGRGAVCINTGGEKVFPEEVEDALKGCPAVRDAVVVGVPDERWGERVAAIVEPMPGHQPTLAELDAYCRTRIAGYKVPRELHLVDTLVRHPSGKPDYRWARATATGAAPARP